MKLSRRGLFGFLGASAGAALIGRVAGKSEDRSQPSRVPGVDLAANPPTTALTYTFIGDCWGVVTSPIDVGRGEVIIYDLTRQGVSVRGG